MSEENQTTLIREFTEDAEDTPLSASRMNQIVRMLNAIRSATVKPDGAGKFVWSDANVILELVKAEAASETGSASVKMFKIQTGGDGNDYVTCKEWTGSAEIGSAVNVAKPFNLRIAQKPTGGTGTHVCDRPYTADEILYTVEPTGGTGVSGVTILDLNVDAREWAYELRWCEAGTGYKGLVKVRTVSAV